MNHALPRSCKAMKGALESSKDMLKSLPGARIAGRMGSANLPEVPGRDRPSSSHL